MKFFTIIFNILIIKSLCEPIYKYQLRHMYKNEKNIYINITVGYEVDRIRTIVINNAKQNINTTYFDLYSGYFLDKLRKLSELEIFQNQNNYGKSDTQQQIKYQQCLTKYGNPGFYNGYFPYNIPIKLIISKILHNLTVSFPDSDIVKIINDKSCCIDTYSISWD
jgi:hypothetical protein